MPDLFSSPQIYALILEILEQPKEGFGRVTQIQLQLKNNGLKTVLIQKHLNKKSLSVS